MTKLIFVMGLLLIMGSVIMLGCGNGEDEGEKIPVVEPERISLDDFEDLLDSQTDIVIVDTRSLMSYELGHIPGAISVPYPDEIRARYQELPRDKMIIFYCS